MKKYKFKEKERVLNANKPFLISVSIIFFIYSLTLIFPFVWLLMNSVKDYRAFMNNPMAIPAFSGIHLENYVVMFKQFNLPKMFLNTMLMCLVVPTVHIMMSNMVAYACAKYKFIFNKLCYFIAMVSIYVNISGTLPFTYKLMSDLGLIDNFLGIVILSSGGLNFQFLVMLGIYSNISNDYKEAAEMDGAGRFRIYLQVYFPQVFPTCLAFWILGFIGQWNNYTVPYLYWPSQQTIATGIRDISNSITTNKEYMFEYPKLFAAMLLTIVPVVVLYAIFQKPINNREVGSGVKG